MNSSILNDQFGYHLGGDADCDSLDANQAFTGTPQSFEMDNSSSLFRQPENDSSSSAPVLPASNGFDYVGATVEANSITFGQPMSTSIQPLTQGFAHHPGGHASAGAGSYAYLSHPPSHLPFSISGPTSHSISTTPSVAPAALYSPVSTSTGSPHIQNPQEHRPRFSPMSSVPGMPPPNIHRSASFAASRTEFFPNSHISSRQSFPSCGGPTRYSSYPSASLVPAMSKPYDSGGGSPMYPEQNSYPPFRATDCLHRLRDRNGVEIVPELQAKIDKGFFRAESDWTCYRRNYFAVACSFKLSPDPGEGTQLYLDFGTKLKEIHAFGMCISAKVDEDRHKAIELVQHTPKRDKGPMTAPEIKVLKPNPSGSLSATHASQLVAAANSPLGVGRPLMDCDGSYNLGSMEHPMIANFERIQFKKATANNGKRRAAQQYFLIVVELYVKVLKESANEYEWLKIAQRVSAQMVVRGRSPGHYQDERRNSSASMGPGGSMGPSSGISHGGGYSSGYTNRSPDTDAAPGPTYNKLSNYSGYSIASGDGKLSGYNSQRTPTSMSMSSPIQPRHSMPSPVSANGSRQGTVDYGHQVNIPGIEEAVLERPYDDQCINQIRPLTPHSSFHTPTLGDRSSYPPKLQYDGGYGSFGNPTSASTGPSLASIAHRPANIHGLPQLSTGSYDHYNYPRGSSGNHSAPPSASYTPSFAGEWIRSGNLNQQSHQPYQTQTSSHCQPSSGVSGYSSLKMEH